MYQITKVFMMALGLYGFIDKEPEYVGYTEMEENNHAHWGVAEKLETTVKNTDPSDSIYAKLVEAEQAVAARYGIDERTFWSDRKASRDIVRYRVIETDDPEEFVSAHAEDFEQFYKDRTPVANFVIA